MFRQWENRDSSLPCPYPVPVTKQWQKFRSVSWSPTVYWVLRKCLETSAAPSARGQDHSTVHVTIMSVSVSMWVYHEPVKSSPFWAPSTWVSHIGQRERNGKDQTAGLLKPVEQVKVREFLLSQLRVSIRTSICKGWLKLKLSGSKLFREKKHLSFLSHFITNQNRSATSHVFSLRDIQFLSRVKVIVGCSSFTGILL